MNTNIKIDPTTIKTFDFAGRKVHLLTIDNEPWFIASEIALALGYSDPKQIAKNISASHAQEYEMGVDYRIVEGEDLRAIRSAMADLEDGEGSAVPEMRTADLGGSQNNNHNDPSEADLTPTADAPIIHPFTRKLLLLSESGVNLACILANTSEGRAFRRWLSREVLPKLRRGGLQALDLVSLSLEERRSVVGMARELRVQVRDAYACRAIDYTTYVDGLRRAMELLMPDLAARVTPSPMMLAQGKLLTN